MDAEVRRLVMRLDGYGCVAPALGALDACRDKWGGPAVSGYWPLAYKPESLTIDRTKDQLRMGKAAPYDVWHCATLCWHHHLGGWADTHRPALRAYIYERNTGAGLVVAS